MTSYSEAAGAFRETTKWLVAFVPVATLVGAVVVVGRPLIHQLEAGEILDALDWAAIGAPVVGLALIVFFGAAVLRPKVPPLPDILDPNGKEQRHGHAAMSEGVGEPYFGTLDDFKRATIRMKTDAALTTDPDHKVLAAITTSVRDWVILRRTASRFRWFLGAYMVGIVFIAVGVLTAAVRLESPLAAIEEPTPVVVTFNNFGLAELTGHTGCTSDEGVTFVAVGGTWDRPRLWADGPADTGCRFGAQYDPTPAWITVKKPETKSSN